MLETPQHAGLTIEDAAEAALKAALRLGADAAESVVATGQSLSIQIRDGKVEESERTEASDLGLRVFIGASSAIVSTNDLSVGAIEKLAERAVAIARAAPGDPYAGLADPSDLARGWPDLDLADTASPSPDDLAERARRAEAAARAVAGVTRSLGASASAGRGRFVLLTSTGFSGGYESTRYGTSATAVIGAGTAMQRDYDYASARHLDDLEAPEAIGRRAGERAARRQGVRRMATGPAAIVFEPRVAASLVGHFTAAINGRAVARKSSFLKDRLGEEIFPAGITIVDDPLRPRGLASRPFDGEGLAVARRELASAGRLTGWLLDLAAARQLGLAPTGNAARGIGGPPSPAPSNLTLEAGNVPPGDLIAGVTRGLYVTGLIGMGVNGVTGDYSRGAEGIAIENGALAYPVNEVTIAGNLVDMFKTLVAANDLEIRTGRDAPTLAIEGMTLAGA